jgi:hypothetical protein
MVIEKSVFFNSASGDRKYKAEDWAEYFASFIGDGVFPNPAGGLKIVSNNSMSVTISPGKAWIKGYYYRNTSGLNITLSPAHGTLNRIDRVVIRLDLVNRVVAAAVQTGEASVNPVAPSLQRDADIYELAIGDAYIDAGAISAPQQKITDTRPNASLCGYVAHVVQALDMSEFFNEASRAITSQTSAWKAQTDAQQTDWLEMVADWQEQIVQIQTDYNAWRQTVNVWKDLATADLAQAVTFAFDNQFAYPGTRKRTTFLGNEIISELLYPLLDKTLAIHAVKVLDSGDIEVTETVYDTQGNIFRKVKSVTTFSENGVSTEVNDL